MQKQRWRPIFDALLPLVPFEGLWLDFELGTFNLLLTLGFVEELAEYAKNVVYQVWFGMTGETHKHSVDAYTVRTLQGRSPVMSKADRGYISEQFDSGLVFSSVKDVASRAQLKANCLATKRMIPSLFTFIRDSRWLEPSSKILRELKPSSKLTIRNSLYDSFMPSRELPIERRLRLFSQAYRRLCLYTFRHFPSLQSLQPRLDQRKRSGLDLVPSEEAWGRFVSYARQEGFEVSGRSHSIEPVFHDEQIDDPIFTTNSPMKFNLRQRCGRMYEGAFLTNQTMLFLENVYSSPPRRPGRNITDFAIARDIFTAFFGENDVDNLCIFSDVWRESTTDWNEVKNNIARVAARGDGVCSFSTLRPTASTEADSRPQDEASGVDAGWDVPDMGTLDDARSDAMMDDTPGQDLGSEDIRTRQNSPSGRNRQPQRHTPSTPLPSTTDARVLSPTPVPASNIYRLPQVDSSPSSPKQDTNQQERGTPHRNTSEEDTEHSSSQTLATAASRPSLVDPRPPPQVPNDSLAAALDRPQTSEDSALANLLPPSSPLMPPRETSEADGMAPRQEAASLASDLSSAMARPPTTPNKSTTRDGEQRPAIREDTDGHTEALWHQTLLRIEERDRDWLEQTSKKRKRPIDDPPQSQQEGQDNPRPRPPMNRLDQAEWEDFVISSFPEYHKTIGVETGLAMEPPSLKRRHQEGEEAWQFQQWESARVLLDALYNGGGYRGLHVVQILPSQVRHEYFRSKDAYQEAWKSVIKFCRIVKPVIYGNDTTKFHMLPCEDHRWETEKPCSSGILYKSFDTLVFSSKVLFVSDITRPGPSKRAKVPSVNPDESESGADLRFITESGGEERIEASPQVQIPSTTSPAPASGHLPVQTELDLSETILTLQSPHTTDQGQEQTQTQTQLPLSVVPQPSEQSQTQVRSSSPRPAPVTPQAQGLTRSQAQLETGSSFVGTHQGSYTRQDKRVQKSKIVVEESNEDVEPPRDEQVQSPEIVAEESNKNTEPLRDEQVQNPEIVAEDLNEDVEPLMDEQVMKDHQQLNMPLEKVETPQRSSPPEESTTSHITPEAREQVEMRLEPPSSPFAKGIDAELLGATLSMLYQYRRLDIPNLVVIDSVDVQDVFTLGLATKTEYIRHFDLRRRSHFVLKPVVNTKPEHILLVPADGTWNETSPFSQERDENGLRGFAVLIFIAHGHGFPNQLPLTLTQTNKSQAEEGYLQTRTDYTDILHDENEDEEEEL